MTARGPEPAVPADLGESGTALWRRLTDAYELEPWELTVVELAARQADDLAALDAVFRDGGILTAGSQGQVRLSGVVTEARQARTTLARLLGLLRLPTEDGASGKGMTAAGRRAQAAADKRWSVAPRLSRGKGADRSGETA